MWFWIFMFICNLIVPLLMIIFGKVMYQHTPKTINSIYGYRTKMSMKNKETWQFAHNCCGKLWVKIGYIMLVPTIIVQLPFINSNPNIIGTIGGVISIFQIAALLYSIVLVEKGLKINFDSDGRRR